MLIEPKRLGSGCRSEPAKSLNKLTINKGCNLNTHVGKARLGKRALHCRFATPGFYCYRIINQAKVP